MEMKFLFIAGVPRALIAELIFRLAPVRESIESYSGVLLVHVFIFSFCSIGEIVNETNGIMAM